VKKVQGFLDKFQALTPPQDAVRSAVATAASAVLGTTVTKDKVRVQNGVAFVTLSSVAKNKLRIGREAFFALLYERLPKARQLVRDVR
jgi:hypothetical protein